MKPGAILQQNKSDDFKAIAAMFFYNIESCIGLFIKHHIIPVSYTHLDVYKRQVFIQLHGGFSSIPAVEISHEANVPGIWRPHAEPVHFKLMDIVTSKKLIRFLRLTNIK